ncbi:Metallothionein-like protein type 2 [Nymphaea thermarum]|nr:Metallothionein-like protein type 2 [Nymphaea thermarum]
MISLTFQMQDDSYLTVSEAKGHEILISGVAQLVGYTSSSASYGLDHVPCSSLNFPCSMNFANLVECRSFNGVPERIQGGNDLREGCKCRRCKMFPDLTVSEAKGAEILISGVAPIVGRFSGVLEMVEEGYDVSEGCKCGKCKMFPDLTVSEAKGAEILISGVAPLVGRFNGVLEMVEEGYDVSEGCKCGRCGCDPCTCK